MAGTPTSRRMPRTGEPRKHRRILVIDRLPQGVKDEIVAARAASETWQITADRASAVAGRRLPRTSVQRWYDLRVEQPAKEAAMNGASLTEVVSLLKQILSAVTA